MSDLQEKAEKHKNELSCLMVTYPSTHGVYEESIKEITDIIHQNGGQVYMDGANMMSEGKVYFSTYTNPTTCLRDLHIIRLKTYPGS